LMEERNLDCGRADWDWGVNGGTEQRADGDGDGEVARGRQAAMGEGSARCDGDRVCWGKTPCLTTSYESRLGKTNRSCLSIAGADDKR
jgi:hypothetical protein